MTGEPFHDSFFWKLWVPIQLVPEIKKNVYDDPLASHGGIHKTLERVRRYYFWPGLVKTYNDQKKNFVCKSTKAPNHTLRPPMGVAPESQRAFQIYMDFLGPYPRSRSGNVVIFIVLDRYSKFVFLKAVMKLTADKIVKYLQQELFHTFGIPENVVTDNGSQFRAELFQKLLRENKISHTLTAVHSPEANTSERVNRSVISAIRSYIREDQKDCDEHLSSICCASRDRMHSSRGTTPYYMVFGQHFMTSGATYKLLKALSLLDDKWVAFSGLESNEATTGKE